MKSRLIIRINSYLAPFGNSPKTGDWIGINLDDGNSSTAITQIHEAPSINRTVLGLYRNSQQNATDSAKNLANKLSADWRNVGGFGNVVVTYSTAPVPFASGNYVIIELQNPLWTFDSVVGQAISNGKATVVLTENAPAPVAKTLTLTQLTTVNCATGLIDYTAAMTGGSLPYTISGTASGNVQSTTVSRTIQLRRGVPVTVSATDSTGASIGSQSLTPIIALNPSLFTISVRQDGTNPLASISENVVLPTGLFPIEYSLDETNWSSSGNFPNLGFGETYTAYIRDTFGCVVEKTFVTPEDIEGNETLPEVFDRYFKISNAGTLIFSEVVDFDSNTKPNFSNTLSCKELVNIPYKYVHEFHESDLIVQQFKSSYDFHTLTLVTPQSKTQISPVLQSQNLRLQEKVDVLLFRMDNGALGIYFRNGNTYVENTTTVNGSSEYDSVNLPTWGRANEKVNVDGIGTVTIKRVSRDLTRGLFLETNTSYSSLTDDAGKVQANYNAQPYNTYEFGQFMSTITDRAVIYIEAGFNGQVEKIFKSELIKRKSDTLNTHLFQWSDPLNKAGIVHQTGISHFARLKCSFTFKTNSESQTYRGDNETFNLDQEVFRTAELKIAVNGHGMENKLHLAGGMEYFLINGIGYKKSKMESERVEGTNVYIITATFETGGNELEINEGELVLREPLTGKTGTPVIPETIPIAVGIGNGGLLINGAGGFVLIDDGN